MIDYSTGPAREDLYLTEGATFARSWVWEEFGDPVDLSGFELRAEIRPRAGSDRLILDLRPFLTGGVDGKIGLLIPAEETVGLAGGAWDLEVETDLGVVRLLAGRVSVSPEVTKDGV